MELRDSAWNKLWTTVGRTKTKMNVHFVPRFFICLREVNTHRVRLPARMLVPPQDFSLSANSGFLRHGYKKVKKYLEIKGM